MRGWLSKPWAAWRDEVLGYLRVTIPEVDKYVGMCCTMRQDLSKVLHLMLDRLAYKVEVRLLAHAMVRPVRGMEQRAAACLFVDHQQSHALCIYLVLVSLRSPLLSPR